MTLAEPLIPFHTTQLYRGTGPPSEHYPPDVFPLTRQSRPRPFTFLQNLYRKRSSPIPVLAEALASKMSNPDDDSQASGIPEWQRAKQSASDAPATPTAASDSDNGDTLAVARRFLDTDEVRSSSREKQAEFLKTKGVSEENIQRLLAESQGETQQTKVSCFHSQYLKLPMLTLAYSSKRKRPPRRPRHHKI